MLTSRLGRRKRGQLKRGGKRPAGLLLWCVGLCLGWVLGGITTSVSLSNEGRAPGTSEAGKRVAWVGLLEGSAYGEERGEIEETNGDPKTETIDESGGQEETTTASTTPAATVTATPGEGSNDAELPVSERIQRGRLAFTAGDYLELYTLLRPVVRNDRLTLTRQEEQQVLPWFAAGAVIKAQQETSGEQRRQLNEEAKKAFQRLLEHNPDYRLERLIYPEQVVIVFEGVATSIGRGQKEDREGGGQGGRNEAGKPVYIEREVKKHYLALVFLPFGLGQFQNGDLVKGTLAASIQVASLATNVASFAVIEGLRGKTGTYSLEDYRVAKAWRATMYTSLGLFLAAYVASVIDGWIFFKDFEINIRTLDSAPKELREVSSLLKQRREGEEEVERMMWGYGGGVKSGAAGAPPLRIGLSIQAVW